MQKIFVDTGAWFAFLVASDPDHEPVSDVIENWSGRLVTSEYVFDELVTLLRYRASHASAVRVGNALRSGQVADVVIPTAEDLAEAWSIFRRHGDKRYSFTDCTSFAVMKRLAIETALAVDRHFRQAGFNVLPSMS